MPKNKTQKQYLLEQFEINHDWTFEDKIRFAEHIGMTVNQVSKWNWD